MVADKGKKLKIEERDDEESLDDIDESIYLTIEKLQDLQDELEKVNEEACEKILEVEQKYSEIRRPVYIKREEVIKAIPDFWSTAFLSHPSIDEFLRPEDQKVFEYLSSLEMEDFKDVKSGYSITFNFKPNPYFEDTKLLKTYFFPENEITKVTGTTIKWKKGMDITKDVNHEKKGSKRPYVDDRRSFFCWFSDIKPDDIVEVSDSEGWVAHLYMWETLSRKTCGQIP
ncbi:Testis-specific y-encoded-like protein [Thalictrum thalictroides]|uniref:Testis-specific y-encoded-like protein n=1 Tax=Thalictrum thalictroides TaxID=46969 RepID=A0A7J6W7Q4_THATH|nr:Testis-specific y-encoded-like protein [Thalictrum thalictroides]